MLNAPSLRSALLVLTKHRTARARRAGATQQPLFGSAPAAGQQLVQVREHLAHDKSGVHVVAAHLERRPAARPPEDPAQRFSTRGLAKLRDAIAEAHHPDVAARLRRSLAAVDRETSHEGAARQLGRELDALSAPSANPTGAAPVGLVQAAGERLAAALRRDREAWERVHIAAGVEQQREKFKDRANLHPLYSPIGAPRPGERGYQPETVPVPGALDDRAPAEVASTLLNNALDLYEDPDVGMWMAEGGDDDGYYWTSEELDQEAEGAGWSRADLPDLLGVPMRGPDGRPWDRVRRLGIAESTFALAAQVRGDDFTSSWRAWPELRRAPSQLPRELAEAVIEDALQPERIDNPAPRIVVVSKEEAGDFVARHHSKLEVPNMRGVIFTIGLRVGGRLAAVALANTPSGRWEDPHRVLDVTRIASDRSFKGASSALMARLMELVDRARRPGAVGPNVVVTYSLLSEAGTTYRALKEKGLRPVAITRARSGGGARADDDASLKSERKLRWEYGPGAGPADWSLLDEVGPGAQDAAARDEPGA